MDQPSPLTPEEARLRPTYAIVRLSRLRANLAAVKAHVAPAQVMPILKANAYGHGLEAVARALAPLADAFGVALVEEGIALRRLGIETPILVFGGVWTRQIPLFLDHGLTLTVPSLARLRDVEEAAAAQKARARVHLKIDTGMERIGVHHYNAEGLLEAAARSPYVEVLGIYSHFANADADDLADTRRQLARFEEPTRSPSPRHGVRKLRRSPSRELLFPPDSGWQEQRTPIHPSCQVR
jgi:alanine racemase